MRSLDNNTQAFFALVRAGLWEDDVRLSQFNDIDFSQVLKLAEEQSVVGLVAAGLEHVSDLKVPKEIILQFVGLTLQMEERNKAMNSFVAEIIGKLRKADIYALLVKGQGIAQCYERPMWRSCGDVDLLLSADNYEKAKAFLAPLTESIEPESGKHLGMSIGKWMVELHGDQHCGLSKQMDKVIDEVQNDIFYGGNIRSWTDCNTMVFLPAPDNDVVLVFTHFLKHFYKEGLGLRQICDWCRLLWAYRFEINTQQLEKRIRKAGLMSEWQAFGAFAVEYFGMLEEFMPLYSPEKKWKTKAAKICAFIIEVGNMGYNRDVVSNGRKSFVVRKVMSLSRRVKDVLNHIMIFPLDTLRYFPYILFNGLRLAAKGIG